MKRMRIAALSVVFAAMMGAAWAAPAVYLGNAATDVEQAAAIELQRYLYVLTGNLYPIESVDAVAGNAEGFVLGTPQSLPDLSADWPWGLAEPAGDGYILHALRSDNDLVVVAGALPRGVQNGVFGLLEACGFGFYLGRETYPDGGKKLDDIADFNGSYSPAFSVRGSIPWHSFVDGPAAWSLEDYKVYIDRLVRMRCNLVAFKSTTDDPFTAYVADGQVVAGAPLPDSGDAEGPAMAMATDSFFAGTGAYFGREYFGAESALIDDPAQSVQAAKEVLRDAIAYAKGRGMLVGLGFEAEGDPFDADVQAGFVARLREMIAYYPALDYVWVWEAEGRAVNPVDAPAPGSEWAAYTARWAGAFDGLAPKRQAEAARIAAFAALAQDVVAAAGSPATLVLSGWGGDEWLGFSDFLPGLDKALPQNVVFAGLDSVRVAPAVAAGYGAVAAERERWPVLHLEHDGDPWFPQPNLNSVAAACRDAQQKGCQGLLGAHWRTRDPEASAAFAAQFAWNSELTVEAFLDRRARDLFGEKLGPEIAPQLQQLENLGYRWVGGAGPVDCGVFNWAVGTNQNRAELLRIALELRQKAQRSGLIETLPGLPEFPEVPELSELPGLRDLPVISDLTKMTERLPIVGDINVGIREILFGGSATPSNKQANLENLLTQINYVLMFDAASLLLMPGSGLDALVYDERIDQVATLIQESKLAQAMHTYARRVATKDELAALASMNTTAWGDIRQRSNLSDEQIRQLTQWPAEVPNPAGVLVLADRVVVLGEGRDNAAVKLQARRIGERRFIEKDLERIGGGVFALEFPEELQGAGNVEFGLEVAAGTRQKTSWPMGFPQNLQTASLLAPAAPAPAEAPAPAAPQAPAVTASVDAEAYRVVLTWEAVPGEIYTVARGSEQLGTVMDGWFADTAPPSGSAVTYQVTARNVAADATANGSAQVSIPELPLPDAPADVRVIASRGGRTVLGWTASSPIAGRYAVLRTSPGGGALAPIYVDAYPGQYLRLADDVSGGEAYTYRVAAVAPDGRMGEASGSVGVIASPAALEPSLRLSYEDESFLEGMAQVAASALVLGGSGWEDLPAQPNWERNQELTLSAWVKLNDLEGMPVMICKGAWERPAYFLQIYHQQPRFYVAGIGSLDAGKLAAGQWHQITATYGNGQMYLYVDGERVGGKRVGEGETVERVPAVEERFEVNDVCYLLRGMMDEIRVYSAALAPEEVAALYADTKRE